MRWVSLLLCLSLAESSTIQALDGERFNAPFQVRVNLDEAVTGFTADDIKIVKGAVVRASPSSDPVETAVNDFQLSGQSATFSVQVKSLVMDFEVPLTIQIQPGAFQTPSGQSRPVSLLSTVVVFDAKPPVPSLSSSAGSFFNSTTLTVAVNFGEKVTKLTQAGIHVSSENNFTFGSTAVDAVNETGGEYNVVVSGLAGEGRLTVAVLPNVVKDVAGNLNAAGNLTLTRDVTPISLTLSCPNGTSLGTVDSFRVNINTSEPVLNFTDDAVLLIISNGRGAAGRSTVTNTSSSHTSFTFLVNNIAPIQNKTGQIDPTLTISLQVKPGSLLDRAGNPSPVAGDTGRNLEVVVQTKAETAVAIPVNSMAPTIQVAQPARVGSIQVRDLIIIVCVLGGTLILCLLLLCCKKRKEANEAPDAFKKYGRRVYGQYGVPESAGGITLEQIVKFSVDQGYNEERSRLAATRLMTAADTNKDNLLSEEEFLAWLRKVIKQERKRKNPNTKDAGKITHRDVLALRKGFPLLKNSKQAKGRGKPAQRPAEPTETNHPQETQEMEPMIAKKEGV